MNLVGLRQVAVFREFDFISADGPIQHPLTDHLNKQKRLAFLDEITTRESKGSWSLKPVAGKAGRARRLPAKKTNAFSLIPLPKTEFALPTRPLVRVRVARRTLVESCRLLVEGELMALKSLRLPYRCPAH